MIAIAKQSFSTRRQQMTLIFTQYFSPAYKAGGPITSISNLISEVKGEFKIFARGHDLNETKCLAVDLNKWTNSSINWYVGFGLDALIKYCKELNKQKHNPFYVNGIFDLKLNLLPILFSKKLIIAPRGMLQKGALANGTTKKSFYLAVLRVLLRNKQLSWHATDEVEANDIATIFGRQQEIVVIPNLVKQIAHKSLSSNKKVGHIKLVYYSLISEKKNLLFLLELLNQVSISFELHVYGPDKDVAYANKCKQYVSEAPNLLSKVKFHGAINPTEFGHIADQFDYYVLPTLGENFGHAIVESLSFGLPVIISDQTPWLFDTSTYNFSLSIKDTLKWKETLDSLEALNVFKHQEAKEAAFMFYKNNVLTNQNSAIQAYQILFQV